LLSQTEFDLPAEEYDYLAIVNQWNIDTRYPDYKEKIYSVATESYLADQFEKF
jgi:hypothetical protein